MNQTNQKIDQQLRKQLVRKIIFITVAVVIFVSFMSYTLYRGYGPGAETIDYFPEVNQKSDDEKQ